MKGEVVVEALLGLRQLKDLPMPQVNLEQFVVPVLGCFLGLDSVMAYFSKGYCYVPEGVGSNLEVVVHQGHLQLLILVTLVLNVPVETP